MKLKKILAVVLTIAMALSVCSVTAFAAVDYEYDTEYTIAYSGSAYYDQIDLWSELEDELSYKLGDDIVIEDMKFWTEADYEVVMDYGSLDLSGYDKGTYEVDLTEEAYEDLYEYGYLHEKIIYYWATDGYWDYEGEIEITITTDDYDLEYELEGDSELYLGQLLAEDLNSIMSETLDYVYLEEDSDNDCGTLYVDDYAEEVFDDDERYYYNEDDHYYYDVEDLYFVADGSEGEFILYYYAYGVDNEEIEGVITIYCDGGLLIEVDMTSEDIYTFDSEVFQDAVDEWDDDYSLIYIDNVKLTDSTDGTLYYDYVEGSNRNVEISNREEYYVDETEEDVLDDISFVPDEDTSGTVTISFTAFVEKRKGSDETLSGTLKINVTKAADITVYADEEEEVEIDWEVFQEYLEEDTDSDDYEVAYVVISGAPRNEQNGYLICDGDDLTTRGDKTFYLDPSRTQYDLENLSYMGGTKKGTYSATFTVYYYKNSTNRAYSTHEGTINFIVGQTANVSNSLTGMISASETMSFASSLSAFEALGGNDNVYITFATLPVGGKLVYGWGTSAQEDVRIGTEYYLSYTAGEKMLSNVTFVPSYSASKTARTVTISVRGFDKNDKAILGTINIGIAYASKSSQFTDVTTNTYADSVDFLYNQRITTGATTYTFNPTGNVKRAEFVTFLWRAAGSPVVTGVTNQFTDVKSTGEFAYAYNAILWAVKNGITTGTTATTFSPAANVTHEQLIAFLYRYDVNLLGHDATGSYGVSYAGWSTVPQYAQAPAKWAAYKGILTDSTTYPTTAGTRATVALWLHRMLTL